MTDTRYPKLRPIETRPILRGGRRALMLRDPLEITEKTLVVPEDLAPLLGLCDGTREDARDLAAAYMIRYGLRLRTDVIAELLAALDEACLLDNGRFKEAREGILTSYRAAPFRPPSLAGRSYPATPEELKKLLDGYLEVPPEGEDRGDQGPLRGLISPHIDYGRGGAVYGRLWGRAAAFVREAGLAVILGTDHYGRDKSLTLTRQHYATPYGVLPTAAGEVEALAAAIGEEEAFAEELNHRTEHSVELAAVWLHHVRGGRPCPVVPILCGSFAPFLRRDDPIASEGAFERFIETLRGIVARGPVVVIAAADLSHVGPAFGGPPLDLRGRALLREADEKILDSICRADAEGFLVTLQRDRDGNNVCGTPPIYFTLRLLPDSRGHLIAYDRCPADERGTSLVSICGVLFH